MTPPPARLRTALVAVLGATALTVPSSASAAPDTSAPTTTAPTTTAATAAIAPQVLAAVATGGRTDFLVTLRTEADLRPAARMAGRARVGEVYRAKRAHADTSQAGLRRMLADRQASYTPYWITNTIRVTGDAALLRAVAARPEVAGIVADAAVAVPEPEPAAEEPTVAAVEWNVDRIGAPRVWDEYDTRGDGIVVANIDTGVQYDHPALQANYRGRLADGGYDHNYNWYDPTGGCTTAPCDINGHGTHTMGTMAGADGIGVAPGARWIAARSCPTGRCTQASLLAAGQWILAPTDLTGRNPRPDLAPDVVNNSWGISGFYDPFFEQVVAAWVTAGIFPAFSNGNTGPGCSTVGSPASYTGSYGTGAFDADNVIARFSSRGPGLNGLSKPDIAAPGVNIRSSMPGDSYAALQGTSMASPHTAGAVALLWAAVPSLRRDVAGTRTALGESAIDVADTSCGGTAARNAVFGEGRLDVHAAVWLARLPVGTLAGTVTAEGAAVADNPVVVTGPKSFTVRTGADGGFRLTQLPVGTYRIAVDRYAYHPAERTVQVTEGATADGDVALRRLPYAVLSGTLSAHGRPAVGARIGVTGTPLTGRTDAAGTYRIEVPHGSYDVTLTPPDGCTVPVTRRVDLTADTTLDLTFAATADRFGYTCSDTTAAYLPGVTRLPLTSSSNRYLAVDLPFAFPFYGTRYSRLWLAARGYVTFTASDGGGFDSSNGTIPSPPSHTGRPNNALYPFWDSLYMDAASGVYTATVGDVFVVEWRDMMTYPDIRDRVSVSAMMHRDGTITYQYRNTSGRYGNGSSATIGIENVDGTDALAYSVNAPVVRDGSGVVFHPPAG